MSKVFIIPDVHGRSFWREAVEEYPEGEFIFLGDYVIGDFACSFFWAKVNGQVIREEDHVIKEIP